jgi:hypothetical protein
VLLAGGSVVDVTSGGLEAPVPVVAGADVVLLVVGVVVALVLGELDRVVSRAVSLAACVVSPAAVVVADPPVARPVVLAAALVVLEPVVEVPPAAVVGAASLDDRRRHGAQEVFVGVGGVGAGVGVTVGVGVWVGVTLGAVDVGGVAAGEVGGHERGGTGATVMDGGDVVTGAAVVVEGGVDGAVVGVVEGAVVGAAERVAGAVGLVGAAGGNHGSMFTGGCSQPSGGSDGAGV